MTGKRVVLPLKKSKAVLVLLSRALRITAHVLDAEAFHDDGGGDMDEGRDTSM